MDKGEGMSGRRFQDLSQFRSPKGARGRPPWFVQLWWLFEALLVRPAPQVLYSWRRFAVRLFGAKIGRKVLIRPGVRVTYPWNLTIGDYSWIGDNATLYSIDQIIIGEHSVVSQRPIFAPKRMTIGISHFHWSLRRRIRVLDCSARFCGSPGAAFRITTDPTNIADVMREVLPDHERLANAGQAARILATRSFNWTTVSETWLSLYLSLSGAKRPTSPEKTV